MTEAIRVLVCDLVGLTFDRKGQPDVSAVKAHIVGKGGVFFNRGWKKSDKLTQGKLHFFYLPHLSTEAEILPLTSEGQYDAVIAAATFLPRDAKFRLGGVRIGTGTGNMGSSSWGGGNGMGGEAPLMNTPGFNSRATAQMTFKALLNVLPDIPVAELHRRSVAGTFDTGKDLRDFPTEKLEGKTMAILGYGNIGREVAKLAQAFGMQVKIFARARHREWIESEGFLWCARPEEAAKGSDVLSVHTGLGTYDAKTKKFANAGLVGSRVLSALNKGAVLLNYDRGECVDVKALDQALKNSKLSHAAIDADIFRKKGTVTGPLAPYLPLARKYKGRLALLPHAAADTEHVSRVDGAKQAVDQIFESVLNRRVINLKGDLPIGYVSGGTARVPGVGRVTASDLEKAALSGEAPNLQGLAKEMAQIWDELAAATAADRPLVAKRQGKALLLSFNRYTALMKRLGLEGPFEE